MKTLLTIGLTLTVGLLVLVLTAQEANRREFADMTASTGGAGTITFRFKLGDIRVPLWTPQDLAQLAELPSVDAVEWRGGTLMSQEAGARHVVPLVTVSPGLFALLNNHIVAGRSFTTSDAGSASIVIGTELGEGLFGPREPSAFLGEKIQLRDRTFSNRSFTVIGVIGERNTAYSAASTPLGPNNSGEYDVEAVFVKPTSRNTWGTMRGELAAFLDQRPGLNMLEPVRNEKFLYGGITGERIDFLREAGLLFQLIAWIVAAFTAVISIVIALVESHKNIERWAVMRALGASRMSLALNEVIAGSVTGASAVAVGAIAGTIVASRLTLGPPALREVVISIMLGYGLYLVGSVPAAIKAFSEQPALALRSGNIHKSGSAVIVVAAICIALALTASVIANGIFSTGKLALKNEIAGIGATVVRLDPDRSTLLPVASLAPSDTESLRRAFPHADLTFIDSASLPISANGEQLQVTIIRSDLAFPKVTGTLLAAGSWSENGVVLGADLAESLFPGRTAVGQNVHVSGLSMGVGALLVAGVAQAPSSDLLESLQLRPDEAWLPSGLVPDTASARGRVFVDTATLTDRGATHVAAALNALVPGFAPYKPVEVAGSNLNYLSVLAAFEGRFRLASLALLPLIAAAMMVIVAVGASSRRRLRTVERVVGAPWPDRLARELTASSMLILLTMIPALAVSWGVLHLWAASGDHQVSVSTAWLAIELAAVLLIGLLLAAISARQALSLSPSQELAME